MKRKILFALLTGLMVISVVACGNNAPSEKSTSNMVIGTSEIDVTTAIRDIDICSGYVVVQGEDNGLYAMGRDTVGEFGIGQEELSDLTLVAKDVETFDFAYNYIDTNGDLYITGTWWGDETKTEFSKVDSDAYSYCDDFGTYLVALKDGSTSVHMNNSLKYFDEAAFQKYKDVNNMLYPFLCFEVTGYVSTEGDVYLLNDNGNFDKLIDGNVAKQPYIRNDDIYFLVDDKLYCYGTGDGECEYALVEIDSNVVSLDDGTYTKSDGSIYYATATKGVSVLNFLIGLDESNVDKVLYCQIYGLTDYGIFIVYKSINGKLVYSTLNSATYKLDTIEYNYTLEGVQQLYRDFSS